MDSTACCLSQGKNLIPTALRAQTLVADDKVLAFPQNAALLAQFLVDRHPAIRKRRQGAIGPGSSRALQPAAGGEAIEFAAKVVTLPPKLIALAKRHS
jgi:hypothetical protein